MKMTFKQSPATCSIVSLMIVIFLMTQILFWKNPTSSAAIYLSGGLVGTLLKQDPQQIWRLISPIFVHIGWEHFLFNLITLYFLGKLAENIWGSLRFLVLFFLSGIMGNLFVFLLTPNVLVAGSSTAIFGLFAAIVTVGYFSDNPYLKELSKSYQTLIIINLIFNLFLTNVSIVGHIGGIVGGALVGLVLVKKQYQLVSLTKKYLFFMIYLVISFLCLFIGFH